MTDSLFVEMQPMSIDEPAQQGCARDRTLLHELDNDLAAIRVRTDLLMVVVPLMEEVGTGASQIYLHQLCAAVDDAISRVHMPGLLVGANERLESDGKVDSLQ